MLRHLEPELFVTFAELLNTRRGRVLALEVTKPSKSKVNDINRNLPI